MTEKASSTHPLKVAAVARRTGVSVRALHHYEAIGLLSPAGRTESGHRLYTQESLVADLKRLREMLASHEVQTLARADDLLEKLEAVMLPHEQAFNGVLYMRRFDIRGPRLVSYENGGLFISHDDGEGRSGWGMLRGFCGTFGKDGEGINPSLAQAQLETMEPVLAFVTECAAKILEDAK